MNCLCSHCLSSCWYTMRMNRLSNYCLSSFRYTTRMNRLSNQIFSEPVRPVNDNSRRLMKRMSDKPLDLTTTTVHFYDHARHPETDRLIALLRSYGLFRDEHADFQEEMERLRELRGKGTKQFYARNAQKKK